MKNILHVLFVISLTLISFYQVAMSSESVTSSSSSIPLTSLQCSVTQQGDTEPPFHNEYWDNHREGIYVDVVSGEPLFSSTDKFDSGTGWPSFTQPLDEKSVVKKQDLSHGFIRTEVKSLKAGSHLGHVFNDGPAPRKTRFCINSAALRFIPKEDLEAKGYSAYLKLFNK
jgi:methionine-R-sulfoxide reductase